MTDDQWLRIVRGAVEGRGGRLDDHIAALRENESYSLAYTQYRCGATPRVVAMLLQRAMNEVGLTRRK